VQIERLARQVVADGLTVRELERRLRNEPSADGKKKTGRPRTDEKHPELKRFEDRLRRHLQTDVSISVGKNERGTVTVQFYSADDLERIFEAMGVSE
jgi:ParB family chromosome partitioning protein